MSKAQLEGKVHYSYGFAPIDINGGIKYTDILNTQKYDRIDFVVQLGVIGAGATLTVQECDDPTPSNSTAIGFDYKITSTDAGDTFGAVTEVASTGLAIAGGDDGKTIVVMVRASELTEDYPYVRVAISDPSASFLVGVLPVCYGARYQKDVMPTAQS